MLTHAGKARSLMPQALAIEWLPPLVAAPFVGSFAGTVALRLPSGRGLLLGRSECVNCGQRLGARDLVPIFSWVASRGRCRHCAQPVSPYYPLVELMAILIVVWAALLTSGPILWASCALGWVLLALAASDQRHLILPDQLTLPLIAAGLGVTYLIAPQALADHAIGAAAGFAVFALVAWLYRLVRKKEGLGLGDAKLLAAGGAWASWEGLSGIVLIAAIAGMVAMLALRLAGRPLEAEHRIPFGPYLCLGIWIIWLYGPLEFS